VVDLKTPAGRDVLLRLLDTADVFVHNIKPQKLKGLAPEARRPRLVFAAIQLARGRPLRRLSRL
jgi:crotonobetainyl-CoA:carnitine CoA-transferase CaiB-like acyl-CoA transferase